jgi:hypothetical protein
MPTLYEEYVRIVSAFFTQSQSLFGASAALDPMTL